jgi:arylsulfatase A-like enzyme
MADDVGIWNISAYHRGMMGGNTPNIDRIAREGALFTDYYAQQSCTAGRAAFILGQTPFRTGLLKVGMPASKQGLQDKDPTIAELLKPYGYATAQIGKNHLGDRNEFLPTVHGFDEFYGILYHLNAMEEPYDPDYPKAPKFLADSARAISWTQRHRQWMIRPPILVGEKSASKRLQMRVLCRRIRTWMPRQSSTWKMSMTNWFADPSISSTVPPRRISHSSSGTIPRARMCGRISRRNGKTRAATVSMPTP